MDLIPLFFKIIILNLLPKTTQLDVQSHVSFLVNPSIHSTALSIQICFISPASIFTITIINIQLLHDVYHRLRRSTSSIDMQHQCLGCHLSLRCSSIVACPPEYARLIFLVIVAISSSRNIVVFGLLLLILSPVSPTAK